MSKIFISYRRADSQYVTDSIYDHMVSHFGEDDVFLDVGSIPFGVDFREYLRDQIAEHDVILVVIGQDWAQIMQDRAGQSNDFVRIEIENALAMNKLIIPVLVKNASMPDFSNLPASISDLQWRNSAAIRRQPDLKSDCQRLADGIKQYLSSQQKPVGTGLALSETKPIESTSEAILPAPFAWIDIPSGSGALKTNPEDIELNIPTELYSISKYPITNAQFAKFIEADGYNNPDWWAEESWHYCKKKNWKQPRYWDDNKWNGSEQPVVGISLLEVVAFCLWLSDVTNENIMLPTEEQWQYASQGNDKRIFSWGNEWNCRFCNNSVEPCQSNITMPVTQYEGKGDSPFGVVDMTGNISEWCLYKYQSMYDDIAPYLNRQPHRGGSWYTTNTNEFAYGFCERNLPSHAWNKTIGFRIIRTE